MIEEKNELVITFPSGTAVFGAHRACLKNGIQAEMISIPGSLTAGCGTALKAEPDQKDAILTLLDNEKIPYTEAAVTKVEA